MLFGEIRSNHIEFNHFRPISLCECIVYEYVCVV